MKGFKSVGGMDTFWINTFLFENDVLFMISKDTGKLGKEIPSAPIRSQT